jgi:hypothetical protein
VANRDDNPGKEAMAEKKKAPEEAAPNEGIGVPVEWHYPEGLIGRYSNNIVVQFGENECHISFFEIRPPLIFGSPEEMKEQAKKLKSVRAECVSRIIIAKAFVPQILKAIQETWEKHQAQLEGNGGPKGGNTR